MVSTYHFLSACQYKITVTASDGKYEATHPVDINVTNINDVPPVFDKPSYQLKMSEGPRDSSEPIVKVSAAVLRPIRQVAKLGRRRFIRALGKAAGILPW